MSEPTWTEEQIREAYEHGSTAGTCDDVDDIISALHYRFHGWSEPCCSSPDDAPSLDRAAATPAPAEDWPCIADGCGCDPQRMRHPWCQREARSLDHGRGFGPCPTCHGDPGHYSWCQLLQRAGQRGPDEGER